MLPLRLAHSYTPPYDQDGGPRDHWVVAYVSAEERRLLSQGQTVLCVWGSGTAFPCAVESISERAGVSDQYIVVLDPSNH